MLSSNFQAILICATGLSLIVTTVMILRKQLLVKYSLIWFLLNLILVLLAIFPRIVFGLAQLLNIYSDTNAIFMITIFILYCLCFGFSVALSRNSVRIKDLTQQMGILQSEIDELMGKSKQEDTAA